MVFSFQLLKYYYFCAMFQQRALHFVVDDKIPFIKGLLEPFAEVNYRKGSEITSETIKDADALLVRTRTKCNKALLDNSKVRFIGSATIGTDHIDEEYCRQNGITVANAPGCNSGSVMQYVISVWTHIFEKENWDLKKTTLGVIGVGNVGSKVAAAGRALGMNVLLNDPPRQRLEGQAGFTALESLLKESDIISLHVPLNKSGRDATCHLVDEGFLKKSKQRAWLINTSRGEVADTNALVHCNPDIQLALDVWEHEPEINSKLLARARIATPHIAGYSLDGKAKGSEMVIRAAANYFDLDIDSAIRVEGPAHHLITPESHGDLRKTFIESVRKTYDVISDDRLLRRNPGSFEELRGNYRKRWEFHHYKMDVADQETKRILNHLGFRN